MTPNIAQTIPLYVLFIFFVAKFEIFCANVFLCLDVLIFNLNIHLMYVVYCFHKFHVSLFYCFNNSCKLIPCFVIRCSKHARIVWPNLWDVVGLEQKRVRKK